jgi:hypothetical protein
VKDDRVAAALKRVGESSSGWRRSVAIGLAGSPPQPESPVLRQNEWCPEWN